MPNDCPQNVDIGSVSSQIAELISKNRYPKDLCSAENTEEAARWKRGVEMAKQRFVAGQVPNIGIGRNHQSLPYCQND